MRISDLATADGAVSEMAERHRSLPPFSGPAQLQLQVEPPAESKFPGGRTDDLLLLAWAPVAGFPASPGDSGVAYQPFVFGSAAEIMDFPVDSPSRK